MTHLLLPSAVEPFPKQRWCNSLDTVASYALLACVHRLLARASPRWLLSLEHNDVPPYLLEAPLRMVDPWALSQEQEVPRSSDVVIAEQNIANNVCDNISDWAKLNSSAYQGAERLVHSEPADRLVIGLITLSLSVKFLHMVAHVASDN